jgi:hypothetical protein
MWWGQVVLWLRGSAWLPCGEGALHHGSKTPCGIKFMETINLVASRICMVSMWWRQASSLLWGSMMHQTDGDERHRDSEDLCGFRVAKASGVVAPYGIKTIETSGVTAPRCLQKVLHFLVSARMYIPCPGLGISMWSSMQRTPSVSQPWHFHTT